MRYRYDHDRNERPKTLELIVERVPLRSRSKRFSSAADCVDVRLRRGEDLLRRSLLFAGAKYQQATDTWRTTRSVAISLGLTDRILRRKVDRNSLIYLWIVLITGSTIDVHLDRYVAV